MTTSGKIGVKGIRPSGNELTAPAGTTVVADHCIIPTRDVIRPRRGQDPTSVYVDNDAADANSNRPKTLHQWGTTLLANYTGSGGYKLSSFATFATSPTYAAVGSYAPPDPTIMRMKFAEMAKSLYWTTDAGLYTLDVVGGTARAAGLAPPPCLRGTGTTLSGNPSATGSWFGADGAVAGRMVLGLKDANGVVKLSRPSGRAIVINPANLTVAIGALVRNANVVTATVASHGFKAGDIVDLVLTGGDVGNFDTTNNVITSVTATTVVWAETAANYTNVASVTATSGAKSISWQFYLPSGVSTSNFVQLYRTDDSDSAAIDPGSEFFLAYERYLTATDVSNGYVTIADTTPDDFLGDPLDTNDNSGFGALGSNERPPLCRDLCQWDGRLWGFKTTDRQSVQLRLLGVGSPAGLQSGDVLLVGAYAVKADGGWALVSEYTPTLNVHRSLDAMAVWANVTGGAIATAMTARVLMDDSTGSTFGRFEMEMKNLTDSVFYAATTRQSAFADALPLAVAVTEASSARASNVVTIAATSHGMITGDYALLSHYQADANFSGGTKGPITKLDANSFTYAETGSDATMTGEYYTAPARYKSDDNQQQVRFSRPGIPEAWPLLNTIGGLPDRAEVLRGKPTPDGGELLLCLKDGDTYAVGGQYPYNVRRVDGSASLVAADSLVEHANQLYGFTTQGPATIGSNGVGLIANDIEDQWREAASDIVVNELDLSAIWGLSYESDRQYQLWVPTDTAPATRGYIYHSQSGQWTRWPSLSRPCGLVFRGLDKLVMGLGTSNRLWMERKTFGALLYTSFSDGLGSTTANGSQSVVTTVAVASTGTALAAGDLYIKNVLEGYRRVVSATTTAITLDSAVSVTNGETLFFYRSITPVVTFTVESAGVPGIEKQFRELQLHFGQRNFDNMTVTFSNEHSHTATATVTASPADFVLNTPVTRPSTGRIEVPAAMKSAAMLTISLSTTEAWGYFDLLGYSVSYEPISERSGK